MKGIIVIVATLVALMLLIGALEDQGQDQLVYLSSEESN